jgi:hypothetical protein
VNRRTIAVGMARFVGAAACLITLLLDASLPGAARADFSVQFNLYGVDAQDKGEFDAYLVSRAGKGTDHVDRGNQKITVNWPLWWNHYPGDLYMPAEFPSADRNYYYRFVGATAGTTSARHDGLGRDEQFSTWFPPASDGGGHYRTINEQNNEDWAIGFYNSNTYGVDIFYQKMANIYETWSYEMTDPPLPWDWNGSRDGWRSIGEPVTLYALDLPMPPMDGSPPYPLQYACVGYEIYLEGVYNRSGMGCSTTFLLERNTQVKWFYRPAYAFAVELKERKADGSEVPMEAAVDFHPDPPRPGITKWVTGDHRASVDARAEVSDGVRYQFLGWEGSGDLDTFGVLPAVDFTLTRDSGITWLFEKQYRLRVGFQPDVPASVRGAANPQPAAGDSWGGEGSYQEPYLKGLVADSAGNTWKCDSWTRTIGGSSAAGSGSSIPGFMLDDVSTVTWGCRKVHQFEVRANGVPEGLSGTGFSPAVTTGWATADQPTAFTAPRTIFDYSGEHRYDLDETTPVTVREGGANVAPALVSGAAQLTATVNVTADTTVTWNYRERIRLSVSVSGISPAESADPVECSGNGAEDAVPRCVKDANTGTRGGNVVASGENGHYYEAGTVIVAVTLAQVDGEKTCTGGYIFGASQADGTLSDNRRYLRFVLDRPTRVVWDYADAVRAGVGEALAPPADWNREAPTVLLLSPSMDAQDPTGKYFFGGLPKRLYFLRPFTTVRVVWTNSAGVAQPPVHYVVGWPATPQVHVAGAPVRLMSPHRTRTFAGLAYTDGNLAAVDDQGIFTAPLAGYAVLKFVDGLGFNDALNPVSFAVVRTDAWESLRGTPGTATVGTAISHAGHADPEGRNGYVLFTKAPYLASSPDGHVRAERAGPIIPVNETLATQPDRRMVVAWYRDVGGVGWPVEAVEYAVSWPADPPSVVIGTATTLTAAQAAGRIYGQPDPAQPGFNPNEEHALIDGGALYALRDDLNRYGSGDLEWHSRPYVLLVYQGGGSTGISVYRVTRPASFDRSVVAGQVLVAPLPPGLTSHPLSRASEGQALYHRDRKGGHWAKGVVAGQRIVMQWYYPMQDGFFFPDYDGDLAPDLSTGAPVPFLSSATAFGLRQGADGPLGVAYGVSWPAAAPVLSVGDTLTDARAGLPGVRHWTSGRVIFDESLADDGGPLVKLYAPFRAHAVALDAIPADVATAPRDALTAFPGLPPALARRVFHDAATRRLLFAGAVVTGDGEPWLLPNLMSADERGVLQALSADAAWKTAVARLYDLSRNPRDLPTAMMGSGGTVHNPVTGQPVDDGAFWRAWGIPLGLDGDLDAGGALQPALVSIAGEELALSAGMASGSGHVTLVEGDDPALGDEPVALHVISVAASPVFRGEVRVLTPANVFDERLTLRHTGDFGGEPEKFDIEWYAAADAGSIPALPAPGNAPAPWLFHASGPGLVETTIAGASIKTLADTWFVSRYYYRRAWPALAAAPAPAGSDAFSSPKDQNSWSGWAGAPDGSSAQLAMGWTKRVFDALNLLEARVRDFRSSATSTVVSMIAQLGARYEGDVAFSNDPAYINGVGLIQAYETILRRALALSVDAGINDPATNRNLLGAASRIADLYLLLGNEAYADALDPTIGFSTQGDGYGSVAPSVFAFQNQLPSLLDEELCLLRGRDDTVVSTRTRPYYNRLAWNFTQGDGELAYAQVYGIGDLDGSGVIDAADARVAYPQGHGDAWGHYLTAMTTWMRLLGHPNFAWVPRAESVLVGGAPVLVDYLDERKFAAAAAARARTGAEIVDLTYRNAYVADPGGQWQGYKDADAARGWGVDEWARRAGQGAYFEWAVANALLPAVDADPTHVGIRRVDRTTVPELAAIVGEFTRVQAQANAADRGVNPLGLAKGVVPFDIDPTQVDAGKTHFEQVRDRALGALRNAVAVYDYAASFTRGLRDNQESVEEFRRSVEERENDYLNRLIEIFGYPYPEDIGTTYPTGYDGPDWIHYMYVDHTALTGEPQPPVTTTTVAFNFSLADFDPALGIGTGEREVSFEFSADGAYAVRPEAWTGRRRAPGEAQRALSAYVLADASLARALKEEEYLLGEIETAVGDLQARDQLLAYKISVTNAANNSVRNLEDEIRQARVSLLGLRSAQKAIEFASVITGALGACDDLDKDCWWATMIGGAIGTVAATTLEVFSLGKENLIADHELTKEQVQRETEFKLSVADASSEVNDMVAALEVKYNERILKRLEIFTRREQLHQALGAYQAVVAEGRRLLGERARFRAQTAAEVQEYRYDDLAFRVFRNDALQKYRAQFDLAARYVYLAATAYDYETNLLGTAGGSGADFLADVVRQRSLGQLVDGTPLAGQPGLADPLARMSQDFEVLKTQLGFNNPQVESNRFSLRKELLRLLPDASGDDGWRQLLATPANGGDNGFYVEDLWQVPEFKRFCRPFAAESAGAQPGLVIPFATTIAFGRNFFGKPLAAGDSAYDPSHFSTRVRRVGVWFEGYDTGRLSQTPRAYLVPVGADVLRSPSGDGFATREWNVVDQKLPVPFALGTSAMGDPGWIPVNDTLSDELGGIRRFSSLRAYPDPGDAAPLWQAQMSGDSRLVGRSVWNTRWLLIIPGGTFLADPRQGLADFADSVKDIKLFFQTYAYSGN